MLLRRWRPMKGSATSGWDGAQTQRAAQEKEDRNCKRHQQQPRADDGRLQAGQAADFAHKGIKQYSGHGKQAEQGEKNKPERQE